jgi:hypothetical protein
MEDAIKQFVQSMETADDLTNQLDAARHKPRSETSAQLDAGDDWTSSYQAWERWSVSG